MTVNHSLTITDGSGATRTCRKCHEVKPETVFGKDGEGRRGRICNACRNERRRARGEDARRRALETPEEGRRRLLRDRYGMTPERYQALLEAQGGTCAICNKPPDARKSLAVDHCHRTGAIRALLCMRCNVVVGIYEIHSQAVAKYLADFGTGNPLLDQ